MSVGGSTQGNTDLGNLDPRTLLSTDHAAVQTAFLESLVRVYNAEIVPGMAENWEISPDGITYTFHLRDAKWSDGVPVTSGDFVSAFVRMFQSSPASAIYDDILNGAELRAGTAKPEDLGVKAPDDKTVVFTLRAPAPYFMGLISSHFAAPGRADLVEKYGDAYGAAVESLPSNGPFILTEWRHEDRIVLKKNPDYWNKDAHQARRGRLPRRPNNATKRNMFDNGDLDLYIPVTAGRGCGLRGAAARSSDLRRGRRPRRSRSTGTARTIRSKPSCCPIPNFMKAISYAFDRQAFVDNVLKGNAIPATVQAPAATAVSGLDGKTWGDISPNFGVYHPMKADPEKSKQYLETALKNAGLTSVDDIPQIRPADLRGPAGSESGDALSPERADRHGTEGQSGAGDRQAVLQQPLQAGARPTISRSPAGDRTSTTRSPTWAIGTPARWTWASPTRMRTSTRS